MTLSKDRYMVVRTLQAADTFWRRLRGLMFRTKPLIDEGLLLEPCQAVHTCFMMYPIDVVMVDKARKVVATYSRLAPFRFTNFHREAQYVVELPAGTINNVQVAVGDLLTW